MKQRNLIVLLFVVLLGFAFGAPILAEQLVATTNQTVPPTLQPLRDIVQVAAGGSHTCALNSAGGVKCWGENSHGQLGNGISGSDSDKNIPVDVVGLSSGVAAIYTGDLHTCALTTDSGVKCWGFNGYGQLGDGTSGGGSNKNIPVDVVGLSSGVVAIAMGERHTCALNSAGGVKCWGWNLYGQLGNGTSGSDSDKNIPVDVVGLSSGITAITSGLQLHTCALTTDSGVKCWGENSSGQLGDGTTTQRLTPVDVVGLGSDVVAIAAGNSYTCALTTVGGVECWGMGGGALSSGVTAIAASLHTCILSTGGGVKCWGRNGYGQLGDGTTVGKSTPVDVLGLGSGVAEITAGKEHTCALTEVGGVKCWGFNGYGQLGDGTSGYGTSKSTPVDVMTSTDTTPPDGSVVINRGMTTQTGALSSTSRTVILALSATDDSSGVDNFRVSNTGVDYGDWFNFVQSPSHLLSAADGLKTVYVQYRDRAGNVSSAYTDTITLDSSAGIDNGLSINQGNLWTNTTGVQLRVLAQAGTAEMQVSNDGGFADAVWEPYTLHKNWQITSFGNNIIPRTVYARFRNTVGDTSSTFQDDIILDVTAPESEITALELGARRSAGTSIDVQWSGIDDVSGILGYDVQVRIDTGLWVNWLTETAQTQATYQAEPGHVFSFRTRAQDNAGNWEAYTADKVQSIAVDGKWSIYMPTIGK